MIKMNRKNFATSYGVLSLLLMIATLDLVVKAVPVKVSYRTDGDAQKDSYPVAVDVVPVGGKGEHEDDDDDLCPVEFQGKCLCGHFGPEHPEPSGLINLSQYWPDDKSSLVNQPRFFTICVDGGFNTTKILEHVPNQTEVLIIHGNNFRFLPENFLGDNKRYDQLTMVDLSNNSIEFIHEQAFGTMGNVKQLWLNNNQIRVVENGTLESIQDAPHVNPLHSYNKLNWLKPLAMLEELQLRDAFFEPSKNNIDRIMVRLFQQSSMPQMKVLNLEHNHLGEQLDPQMFCKFTHLQQLLLAQNDLKQFHLDLKCLHELTLIDLSHNQMMNIDDESFDNIASVGSLHYRWNISYNPFHCDCNTLDSYKWSDAMIRQKKQFIDNFNGSGIHQRPTILDWFDQLQCLTPANMTGRFLHDCDECDHVCASQRDHYDHHHDDVGQDPNHSSPSPKRDEIKKEKKQKEKPNLLHRVLEIFLMNLFSVVLFFAVFGFVVMKKSYFCTDLADTVPWSKEPITNVTYSPLEPVNVPAEIGEPMDGANASGEAGQQPPPPPPSPSTPPSPQSPQPPPKSIEQVEIHSVDV